MEPSVKPSYLSKTLWVNLLLALAPFIPGASDFVAANPDIAMSIVAGVNLILRLITKDKIVLI